MVGMGQMIELGAREPFLRELCDLRGSVGEQRPMAFSAAEAYRSTSTGVTPGEVIDEGKAGARTQTC